MAGILITAALVTGNTGGAEPDFGGYRPRYQGFGVNTPGGRGGTVIKVTNLDDSGAGSLREALTAAGARIVIFEISGSIELKSTITIDEPYITIAGQTAPSPGITVRNFSTRIETHDVVIQHMRFRLGAPAADSNQDAIWIRNNAYNVVVDHCSISWATDENLAINAAQPPEPREIAILDSIVSEGLAANSAGAPGRGLLFVTSRDGTATMMRNLLANNVGRNPYINPGWRVIDVNNVVYNPRDTVDAFASYVGGSARAPYGTTLPLEVVRIGNIALPGPDTAQGQKTVKIQTLQASSDIYLADNVGYLMTPANQWGGVVIRGIEPGTGDRLTEAHVRTNELPSWYTAFHIASMPSSQVEAYVLANSGARPRDRDAVDRRVVSGVAARTGRIIESPGDVGGWPVLEERQRALAVPDDPHGAVDGAGRTVIEYWLESFARDLEGTATGPPAVPPASANVTVVK